MAGRIVAKLSSKWVMSGIVVILAVLLMVFFAISRTTKEFTSGDFTDRASAEAEKLIKEDAAHKDLDNDGLSDWEEVLYRTDPKNPDSDGDGVTDGEEIARGGLPLSPNDLTKEEKGADTDSEKNSPFAQFAKNIDTQYSRFSALAEGNLSVSLLKDFYGDAQIQGLTEQQQDQALQETLRALFQPIYEKLPRFSSDSVPDELLTISETSDKDALRNYFNSVASVYEKKLAPLRGEEDLIIDKANDGDKNALKKLSRVRKTLENAQKELIKISAPRPALILHKREVWLTQNAIAQLKILEKANIDDPIYIIMLLDFRSGLRKSIARFHSSDIPQWLTEQKITFTSKDKARLLYTTP